MPESHKSDKTYPPANMDRDHRAQTPPLSQWRRSRTPVGRKTYSSALDGDDQHLRCRNGLQFNVADVTLQQYANLLKEHDSAESELEIQRRDYRAWRAKRKDIDAPRRPSPGSGDRPDQQQISIMDRLKNKSQRAIRALGYGSGHVRDQDDLHQPPGGPDWLGANTLNGTIEPDIDDNQPSDDQRGLPNLTTSCLQDIESLAWHAPIHSRNAYRVTVCHAFIGTSVVGIATSLSLALWWSLAHGDPGSGFTIGSYVLAAFGAMVAIPWYPHSKVCRCWERKPPRGAKVS